MFFNIVYTIVELIEKLKLFVLILNLISILYFNFKVQIIGKQVTIV